MKRNREFIMAFYNTGRERIHPVYHKYMCFNVYMYIHNTSLTTEQTLQYMSL